MEKYAGLTDFDTPKDGGTWDTKHEVCNFANVDGRCHGFVYQTNMGPIDIERIGADPSADRIDDATVVWTAKHANFGTVVVGWYKNATIYRDIRNVANSPLHVENNVGQFYAECAFDDAVLLPELKRTFPIPRGKEGMGQHLIWYADTERGTQTKHELASYIGKFIDVRDHEATQIDGMGGGVNSIGAFDPELKELVDDVSRIEKGDNSLSEKASLINARLGQGKFRQFLDVLWGDSCAVTGCNIREILRASHIKPWRECANNSERLDPDNGLLLSANLDALFDKGFIGFDDSGLMLISPKISSIDRNRLGLGGKLKKVLTIGQKRYLTFHRNLFQAELFHTNSN